MKQYKKYVLGGVFACFMAVALMAPVGKSEAFWPFGKVKKENNSNYTGAVANTESNKIKPAPSITVVSPKGGETLQAGSKFNIKWKLRIEKNRQKNTAIQLSLIDSEKRALRILDAKPLSKSSFVWGIPTDIKAGIYKIQAQLLQRNDDGEMVLIAWDESDEFFKIAQKEKKVGVTVVSPNGGEVWKIGKVRIIKWKTKGIPLDAKINLNFFEEGLGKETAIAIAHGLSATSSSFKWLLDSSYVVSGKKYFILIEVLNNDNRYIDIDTSDEPFLVSPNSMP